MNMKWLDPKTFPIPKYRTAIFYVKKVWIPPCQPIEQLDTEVTDYEVITGIYICDRPEKHIIDLTSSEMFPETDYYDLEDVIAWMPLPESPIDLQKTLRPYWESYWDFYDDRNTLIEQLPEYNRKMQDEFQIQIADVIKSSIPKLAENPMSQEELQIRRMIAFIESSGRVVNEIANRNKKTSDLYIEAYEAFKPLILHLLHEMVVLRQSEEKK